MGPHTITHRRASKRCGTAYKAGTNLFVTNAVVTNVVPSSRTPSALCGRDAPALLSQPALHYNPAVQPGMLAVASLTILTRVTTVSGTPGGGMVKFLGGAPNENSRLSNRHSPFFP